jgi:hypothetical protein
MCDWLATAGLTMTSPYFQNKDTDRSTRHAMHGIYRTGSKESCARFKIETDAKKSYIHKITVEDNVEWIFNLSAWQHYILLKTKYKRCGAILPRQRKSRCFHSHLLFVCETEQAR